MYVCICMYIYIYVYMYVLYRYYTPYVAGGSEQKHAIRLPKPLSTGLRAVSDAGLSDARNPKH